MYQFLPMKRKGWRWFQERNPVSAVEDSSGIVAIDTNGEYAGGFVMDNWTETSVQVHFVILKMTLLRAGFHKACMSYVFEERGRKLIYSLVLSTSLVSIRFIEHMGSQRKCVLKDAHKEGVDTILYELRRENCPYLLKEAA